MGIPAAGAWDIESYADELSSVYSPSDVLQFCVVLGVRPAELLGVETPEGPIGAANLVQRILERCQSCGITLVQFEDAVGWRLAGCIEPPEQLLREMTMDGLQWLCRELAIDWQRVILSL
jgi:hypothetical protein